MSLSHLAVAEPCGGEQLPALLSGLENVRCDTAAAAEGQETKSGHGRGLGARGGDACRAFPNLSMGRGLGKSHGTLEAVLPSSCSLPCVTLCPSGLLCISQLCGGTHWVAACLISLQANRDITESIPETGVYATSKGLLRASQGLVCMPPARAH